MSISNQIRFRKSQSKLVQNQLIYTAEELAKLKLI